MKKSNKKSKKSELLFSLEGKVFLIEKVDGKEVSKEEIDGETVLHSLDYTLRKSLELLKDKENVRKIIKRINK